MKIIAFYLPQFHEIPENNEWWGKGFTEWVNVKKAKPLFSGHPQPRAPLGENYYDLTDDDVKIWQAELARQYGIYGFCYYHYWFNGKLLLEKPMEQMLRNPAVDIPFCICWANEPWTKAWVGKKEVLIPQFYGEEAEWKKHYVYLSQFFRDPRYILDDGRPLMVIYRAEVIPQLNAMLDYWDALAREDGFPGLCYAYQDIAFDKLPERDDSRFDYDIEFQPSYAWLDVNKRSSLRASKLWAWMMAVRCRLYTAVERAAGFDLGRILLSFRRSGLTFYDYDEVWQAVLAHRPENEKCLPGAFVGWDNTPRKGKHGIVVRGDSPEKLEKYMTKQIVRAREEYKKDYIFMYAWNEWAEGGYLEPDERFGCGNLEAIRSALEKTGELPH